MHVRTYVTEELHTYHDQITGVTNHNTSLQGKQNTSLQESRETQVSFWNNL